MSEVIQCHLPYSQDYRLIEMVPVQWNFVDNELALVPLKRQVHVNVLRLYGYRLIQLRHG